MTCSGNKNQYCLESWAKEAWLETKKFNPPMAGQVEVRKAMMQMPYCVKGDFFIPGLTALLLVVIRSLLHDILAMRCGGKRCSTQQSLCTTPSAWSEGCRQNREDTSSFVEPKRRAAPLTFASSKKGHYQEKGILLPPPVHWPWQWSGLPTPMPAQALPSALMQSHRSGNSGMFPSMGSNHILR